MNFNIYELVLGIKLCKVRLDEIHFCNYKENKYFIKALEIIGETYGRTHYGSKCKYTDYRLGVMYVKECAEKRRVETSYRQIKRLARPHCRISHAMKFPTKTYEILEIVRDLIHNPNTLCSNKCMAMKKDYCYAIKQSNILCRDFLIGNFYICLKSKRKNYIIGSYSKTLLEKLDVDFKTCNIQQYELR